DRAALCSALHAQPRSASAPEQPAKRGYLNQQSHGDQRTDANPIPRRSFQFDEHILVRPPAVQQHGHELGFRHAEQGVAGVHEHESAALCTVGSEVPLLTDVEVGDDAFTARWTVSCPSREASLPQRSYAEILTF